MEFRFRGTAEANPTHSVKIEKDDGRYRVAVDGREYAVEVRQPEPGVFDLTIQGRRVRAYVASDGMRRYVALSATRCYVLQRPDPRPSRVRRAENAATSQEAPMPGQVLDVLARPGDAVTRGQTLALLEAMKMELRVTAPFDGQVRAVHCAPGQIVTRGQLLFEVDPAAA